MFVFSIVPPAFLLSFRLSGRIASGRLMSVNVPSKIHVDGGVSSPIGMDSLVIVETPKADIVAPNPHVARSKIDIRAANKADKLHTVPNIRIRDEDYSGVGRYNNRARRWSDYHRRRRDDDRLEGDASVRRNDTAGN